MKGIEKLLAHGEMIVCSLLLCSMVGLQFMQVVARYGVGRSISWAEELSRFSLVALVYISSAIGAQYNTHIRISAQLKRLPTKIRYSLAGMSALIWLAFNIIVIWFSIVQIGGMGRRPMISGTLLWDMRYVYALIPLGFTLQTLRLLQFWRKMWRAKDFTPLFYAGEE